MSFDPFASGQATEAPSFDPFKDGRAQDPYETTLSPSQESNYTAWKQVNAPNDSGGDYDLRGAFMAGLSPAANGHWPDTFKKPNHPTFSVESKYAAQRPDLAGSWDGETYIPAGKKRADPGTLESLFSGPENFEKTLPPEAITQLEAAHKGETDKMGARMRAANTAFLADRFGVDPEQVTRTPEQFKHAYASQVLGIDDPLDDKSFYTQVGGKLTRDNQEHQMLTASAPELFQAMKSGEDFGTAFEKFKTAHETGLGWDAERQDYYRQVAQAQWDHFSQKHEEYAPTIKAVSAYLAQADQPVQTGKQALSVKALRNQTLDALEKLNPDDAQLVLELASSEAAKTREGADKDQGFLVKGARRLERGTIDFMKEVAGAGATVGRDVGLLPASSDRRAQLARLIDQKVSGEVDPLKGNSWIQNVALSTAEVAPKLASFLSISGIIANGIATKEELRGQYEDSGLSPGQADVLSGVAAIPVTALNFLSSKMVFGQVPAAGALFEPIKDAAGLTAGALAKRAVGIAAVELPTQFAGQQLAQAAPAAVQSVASLLSKQIPEVDWEKQLEGQNRATPETLSSLLPLVILGTGTGVFHDRANGLEFVKNETRLRAVGLPEAAVKDVMTAPTPEAAAQVIRENWDKREVQSAPAKEAVRTLNEQAIAHREELGETFTEEQKALFKKYDILNSMDPGHIPVEIRTAKGDVVVAEMNGYQESFGKLHGRPEEDLIMVPHIGYEGPNGWSHTALRDGDTVISPIPSAEQWKAGIRSGEAAPSTMIETPAGQRDTSVSDGSGKETAFEADMMAKWKAQIAEQQAPAPRSPEKITITRDEKGGYTVARSDGEVLGTAKSPETAAQIATEAKKSAETPAPEREPRTTALNKAEITHLREAYNLEELPAPERKGFEDSLQQGKREGHDANAETFSASLLEHPRAISDSEHAGMLIRHAELNRSFESVSDQAALFMDLGNIAEGTRLMKDASAILAKMDTIEQASALGGTELGRAMSARRMRLNLDTYSLAKTLQRARLAKQEQLTPEEHAAFSKLADQLKTQNEKITSLEADLAKAREEAEKATAETFVSEGKATRSRATKQQSQSRRDELKAELRKLSVRVNDITSSVGQGAEIAGLVAKLAKTYIEDGAATLSEVTGQLKKDIPDLTDQDIYNALGGRIKAEKAKIVSEVEKRVTELKKQARLQAQIHDAAQGIFDTKGKTIPSEEVARLSKHLAELRLQAMRTTYDAATLKKIDEKITAAQDQLAKGYRPVPEQVASTKNSEIEKARGTLAELHNETRLTDTIHDLEEQLRTGKFNGPEQGPDLPNRLDAFRERIVELRKEIGDRTRVKPDHAEKLRGILEDLNKQLEGGFRSIPGKSEAAPVDPAIAKLREAITEGRKRIKLQDTLFDLEDRVRRGDTAAPAKKAQGERSAIQEKISQLREQLRDARPKEEGADLANRTAEAELNRLAKSQSDVQAWPEKQRNAVKDALKEQTTEPQDRETFLQKLLHLGVNAETAEALTQAMETERANRAAIDTAKAKSPEEINAERKTSLEAKLAELQAQLEGGFRNVPEETKSVPDAPDVQALRKSIRELDSLLRTEDQNHDLEEQLRTGDYKVSAPEKRVLQSEALQRALVERKNLQRQVNARIEASRKKTTFEKAVEYAALPKSIKTSADMGAALRQLVFLAPGHPLRYLQANAEAAAAAFSQVRSDMIEIAIQSSPNQFYRQRAGLSITSTDSPRSGHEEDFQAQLIHKIPLFGYLNKFSERHMTAAVNLMRATVFDDYRARHPDATLEQQKAYAQYINSATGRGSYKSLGDAAAVVSKTIFSARYAFSRLELLYAPIRYAGDPIMRKELAKDYGAFAVTGLSVLGLASLAGAKVGVDPDSSDFGKIIIGTHYYDIWGGLQPAMRLVLSPAMAGLEHAGVVKAKTPVDPLDAFGHFVKYKASPWVQIPHDLLTGKNMIGQKVTPGEVGIEAFTPMFLNDVKESIQDQAASPLQTSADAAFSFFGGGLSVHQPKTKK